MMTVVGRLRAGVTLEQAQKEMDAIALQLGKEFPKDDADWGVTMATVYDWIVPRAGAHGTLPAARLGRTGPGHRLHEHREPDAGARGAAPA